VTRAEDVLPQLEKRRGTNPSSPGTTARAGFVGTGKRLESWEKSLFAEIASFPTGVKTNTDEQFFQKKPKGKEVKAIECAEDEEQMRGSKAEVGELVRHKKKAERGNILAL